MADDVISIKVIAESSSVDKTNKSVDNLASTLLKTEKEALKIRKAFKLLDSAVNSGKINHQKYSKMVNELNVQETILYKNLGKTTNAVGQQSAAMGSAAQNAKKFADAQRLAGKSTNKFGMYAQQVGYQVGDFFVQVQSGTSALVAFGQQGTQLAGLLPGVAGAVIGIGLSLGTMLLKTFLDTKDAGKQLEESIKGVENALSNLSNVSSMLRDTIGAPFSKANTQLKEYLELLEKSSAAKVQDAVSLAFGAKGESTGILNELKVLADDMTNIPSYQMEWLRDLVGVQYGPTSEEIANAEDILRVREEIAEILRGTAAQPRVIEGTEGLIELGDDLLAYSKKFNGALGERIRNLMFETGLTQKMVDAEKAKGDAAEATTKKQLALIDDLLNAAEKSDAATNANLDAQLALQMKQHDEQLKIDALRDKEHFRLDQELDHAKYLNKFQMNKKEIANSLASIARINYELSLKEKQLTSTEIADLMKKYDLLQREKAENDRILEVQKEKLKAQKELNKEVEKLAERLSIPFQRALELIRQAKAEATVGLDAFGGPGSFKHGGIQTYKPESLKGDKGKEPTTMEGPIKALERQIELSKALFGLEGDARRKEEVYMQLKFQNQDADIKAKESQLRSLSELVAEEERRTRVFEEQRKAQEALADSIAGSMGDAFMSIVDGTKSVKDAFRSMARAIIKELYEVLVVQQLVGSAKAGSRSGIAGGIMDFFGSANGNAMYNGNVIPFANGGVVSGPTTFPMSAGRTGLMGEAGPEAIMPLKRGKDGKLGVQAEGGAGDVVIHQNFNFAANGDESVKKLIAQAAPQIAQMTKSSIISDRRRGGQMKATFG